MAVFSNLTVIQSMKVDMVDALVTQMLMLEGNWLTQSFFFAMVYWS